MASFATTKGNFFRVKGAKFEKSAIVQAVGKAKAAVMSRQGSLVRGIAKKLMHKDKKSSKAPNPPNVHVGLLKKLIFFAFDPKTATVVCGPVKFKAKGIVSNIPEILEHGGQGIVRDRVIVSKKGEIVPFRFLKKETRKRMIEAGRVHFVNRPITIEARPYMAPALKISIPMLAKEWKGKVKK